MEEYLRGRSPFDKSFARQFSPYQDLDGNPVARTPQTYPYSYNMYVQWRGVGKDKLNGNAWIPGRGCPWVCGDCYSDRMREWDWDKEKRCYLEAFGKNGQMFGNADPKKVEKYLQLYFDNPDLQLICIMQGCNHASGYPVWYFMWHDPKKYAEKMQAKKETEVSDAER